MTWFDRAGLWLRARSWCLGALAVVAVVAFLAGRWTAPERVRVEERVVTEWKERVEWWGGYTEKRVEGPKKIRIVERDRPAVQPPPGSPCPALPPLHEKETTIDIAPTTFEASGQAGGREEIAGKQKAERVETPIRPDWRAGALVGLDLGALSLASPAGALVVGGHVERRVLGPFSVGAFALVPVGRPLEPAVGASLSAEW